MGGISYNVWLCGLCAGLLDVVEMTNTMHWFVPLLYSTCFGSNLPSSGSFLDPSELLEIQIEWVVYLKYISDKRISMYKSLCRVKQIEWHINNWVYSDLKYGKNV
jgi:hypothetical protein